MVNETEEPEKPKKINMTEICHNIAEGLINLYHFKTISGKKDDEIYVYVDGVYKPIGKDLIKIKVERKLGVLCKTHNVNEVINKIARKTYIQRETFFCKDLNLVCVNNGVLDLKNRKLLKHSPEYFFLNKIPIDYNPTATCLKILKFLNEVLHEDDIDCIQEWFGYQLYREYFIKKACIFRGVPNTGKTTFINLLTSFIGSENISNVNLQMLAEGKWHLTHLYNKFSNICDDLSEKDIVDSGTFKQVTGRSPLHAEYKFGDQFNFINYAKLSFACNKIPNVHTNIDDEAYWNRWMIFDFDNIFNEKEKTTDSHMIDKITSKEELSGLLNWALEGLERLQIQNFFSYKRDWEINRKIMQGEASNVAKFNNDCVLKEVDNWISNSDLFDKYLEYCSLNGLTPETNQGFAKSMREYCSFGKFGANRGNVFGVANIKVKEDLLVI